jgi:hypothetical protein
MKKVLLLLLLSLLSTQSFAKLCPDGSIPTRAISGDGSFYEYKCVGKQNTYKANTSYGPKRLFDYGTSWMMGPTGLLEGTNGLTCRFLNYYVGTCNNGVNYGLCSNSNNKVCGSDGSSYTFPTAKSIRSSFGSSCRNNGAGTHSVTCNSKSSSSSSSYSSKKIPSNAVFSLNRYGFKCNYGFVREGNSMCVKIAKPKVIPENAYSTGSFSSGDGWDCMGGYVKKGNKCVSKSTNQETKVIPESTQNESSNYLEEIKQAKELLDSGVITEDEFKDIKKKIIDNI